MSGRVSGTVTGASAPCPLCGGERWEALYTTHAEGMETAARFWQGKERFAHVLCANCGLVHQEPLPGEAQLARFYDGFRFFRQTGRGFLRQSAARTAAFLRTALAGEGWSSELRGMRALDVGCGGGELLRALRTLGAEVLGLELSHAAGEQAEEGDVSVVYGGGETPPPGAPFDLVCSITVLEHLRDPLGALRRLRAWTREDGRLLLEVPDLLRPRIGTADFLCYQHLWHFVPATFRGLLARAGLELLARDGAAPHSVRCVARPAACVSWQPDEATAAAVADAVARYRSQRERFLGDVVARLAPLVASGRRLAVFGAGDHSRQLLQALDLAPAVVAFVDSDPAKQGGSFAGRPVVAPEALDALAIDAVLLSSQPFQEEMARTVARVDHRGRELIRLYPHPEEE